MSYADLIARKLSIVPPTGLREIPPLPAGLLPLQSALVPWALRRGRAAIFADTGLGKSRMEVAYGNAVLQTTGLHVLILTTLAVAEQTVAEGAAMRVTVVHAREQAEIPAQPCIVITNYERLHRFDASMFGAVVLDESSCIKHHDAKTLGVLMEAFRDTPYKLCATATPAPNDWTELGTHAEFLGICTRSEMLSEYFMHDGGETKTWRLKGHAREQFWRWVSSWGAMVRKPSDLGFDDSLYILPPLTVEEHHVETEAKPLPGMLFALEASTLSERRDARRASLTARVEACALLIKDEWDKLVAGGSGLPKQAWLIWCDLNTEQDALEDQFGDLAFSIRGSMTPEEKESALVRWMAGERPVMISKPSILGWGINAQHCARMAFVGVTDSFEAYYQAVRRCYRFGQKRPVKVHIFASNLEGSIVANLRRKERDAAAMAEALSALTRDAVQAEVLGLTRQTNPYQPRAAIKAPAWLKSEAT